MKYKFKTLFDLFIFSTVRGGWDEDDVNPVLDVEGERQLEDLLVWNKHVLGIFQNYIILSIILDFI